LVSDDELRRIAAGETVSGERVPFPPDGIVDGDVRVRVHRPEDAPGLVRGLTDAQILRDAAIYSQDGLTEDVVVQRIRTTWPRARREGEFAPFAIADAGSDEYLGNVLLHSFEWDARSCEIGYWLLPGARGRGVSARAARLLATWTIESLDIDRIEALVDFDNTASLRSIERAGFTREGQLRQVAHPHRGRVDFAIFSLLRSDLPPRRRRRSARS